MFWSTEHCNCSLYNTLNCFFCFLSPLSFPPYHHQIPPWPPNSWSQLMLETPRQQKRKGVDLIFDLRGTFRPGKCKHLPMTPFPQTPFKMMASFHPTQHNNNASNHKLNFSIWEDLLNLSVYYITFSKQKVQWVYFVLLFFFKFRFGATPDSA